MTEEAQWNNTSNGSFHLAMLFRTDVLISSTRIERRASRLATPHSALGGTGRPIGCLAHELSTPKLWVVRTIQPIEHPGRASAIFFSHPRARWNCNRVFFDAMVSLWRAERSLRRVARDDYILGGIDSTVHWLMAHIKLAL